MTTTSATGTRTNSRYLPRPAPSNGFTLLELLVVIAIIGIFIGVVTLSTDLVNFERKMEHEAQRLQNLLRLASEEATLQSHDYGLLLYPDGYSFFIFDHDSQDWKPLANDRVLATHTLEEMQLDLWIDERQVQLEPASEFQSMAATDGSETSATADNEGSDDDEEEMSSATPQIVIFSSGEFTPFELKVLRASDPFDPGIVLDVEFDGNAEIRSDEP